MICVERDRIEGEWHFGIVPAQRIVPARQTDRIGYSRYVDQQVAVPDEFGDETAVEGGDEARHRSRMARIEIAEERFRRRRERMQHGTRTEIRVAAVAQHGDVVDGVLDRPFGVLLIEHGARQTECMDVERQQHEVGLERRDARGWIEKFLRGLTIVRPLALDEQPMTQRCRR
ncbi:hypothetical protein B2G71_22240 [Novosphingobium sp. PC22D]|nr:hypothetical protein B2G71_22240 [Novosphingobium sp. PC22D]